MINSSTKENCLALIGQKWMKNGIEESFVGYFIDFLAAVAPTFNWKANGKTFQ
jgi:hypothetical protein